MHHAQDNYAWTGCSDTRYSIKAAQIGAMSQYSTQSPDQAQPDIYVVAGGYMGEWETFRMCVHGVAMIDTVVGVSKYKEWRSRI